MKTKVSVALIGRHFRAKPFSCLSPPQVRTVPSVLAWQPLLSGAASRHLRFQTVFYSALVLVFMVEAGPSGRRERAARRAACLPHMEVTVITCCQKCQVERGGAQNLNWAGSLTDQRCLAAGSRVGWYLRGLCPMEGSCPP